MKANHFLHLSRWDAQVKNFAWNHSILEVENKPFTPAIEDNLVIILTFNIPISLHPRSHFFEILIWNFNCCRVIIRIFRSSSLSITNIFRLSKPRTIFYLIYKLIHVLFGISHPDQIYFILWFFDWNNLIVTFYFFLLVRFYNLLSLCFLWHLWNFLRTSSLVSFPLIWLAVYVFRHIFRWYIIFQWTLIVWFTTLCFFTHLILVRLVFTLFRRRWSIFQRLLFSLFCSFNSLLHLRLYIFLDFNDFFLIWRRFFSDSSLLSFWWRIFFDCRLIELPFLRVSWNREGVLFLFRFLSRVSCPGSHF